MIPGVRCAVRLLGPFGGIRLGFTLGSSRACIPPAPALFARASACSALALGFTQQITPLWFSLVHIC